jgi:hypothetical protein
VSHTLKLPTFGTELSVRPRHFLRGVTLDPHGSETGCGPCSTRWPNTLPRFGIRGDPALSFHDTDRGRRGVPTSTWRKILANLCRSGRGDCAAPRSCTDVTSTVPVLTVLASSVFRCDATALSFATVRWRGVRTHKVGTFEWSAVWIARVQIPGLLLMAALPGYPGHLFPVAGSIEAAYGLVTGGSSRDAGDT